MSYYRLKVLMLNDKKRVNLLCEKMLNYANNNRKNNIFMKKIKLLLAILALLVPIAVSAIHE